MTLMPKGLLWLIALAALLTACSDPREKRASQPEKDPGVYFRMKVGLTYKGKPVDIDFVAGCNVHLGRDLSGGSIQEINGMTDLFRGVRMPEGHAVVINTYPFFEGPRFNPCLGDTTDHSTADKIDTHVPKDWLPFIEWFERDDEFAHGIGYMTQDAYENKNARFGFRYARIEHATRREFEAFRKTGPANLLPPHQTSWMQGWGDPIYYHAFDVPESVRKNPPSGWWHTDGRWCEGLIRWPLAGAPLADVRAAWPKGEPQFWTIADWKSRNDLAAEATKPHEFYANGAILVTHFVNPYTTKVRSQQPEIFPIRNSQAAPYLTPKNPPIVAEEAMIGDGEANRGFVFCDVDDRNILEAVIGTKWKPGYNLTIDGTKVSNSPSKLSGGRSLAPFFDRDDFVLGYIQGFRG